MNEWINVEDRLPEPFIPVLVADNLGHVSEGYINRNINNEEQQYWHTERVRYPHFGRQVTHWMPLPPPPAQKVKK